MLFFEALKEGQEKLICAHIVDAKLDAWYLLSFVTGLTRSDYILRQRDEISDAQQKAYFDLISRRASHIPLQHITGSQEFMGLNFCVNEHVLVPRQDTETLVEEALKVMPKQARVLDMSTSV